MENAIQKPFKEWLSSFSCQEEFCGGSYTALMWLRDRSHLTRSCLPGNVKDLYIS